MIVPCPEDRAVHSMSSNLNLIQPARTSDADLYHEHVIVCAATVPSQVHFPLRQGEMAMQHSELSFVMILTAISRGERAVRARRAGVKESTGTCAPLPTGLRTCVAENASPSSNIESCDESERASL